MSLGNVDAKA